MIVQDLGLARLIRAITTDLEIHASTQMSITSAEGVALARELGCTRVILARELSLAEIGRIRQAIDFPLEVFVHGALCVAYSGQCLTSEALGGRSANRGECAQACRMPYQIVCDGKLVDLDDVQYLLSPQDLAAYDLIPQLVELGVASLKIEGRLKTPEYVANITRHYRMAIDAAWAGQPSSVHAARRPGDAALVFRGFSHGFLDGTNHKVLVRGDHAKKRGILLGRCANPLPGRASVSRRPRRSSRATAWSSTATNRPAGPSKEAASTKSSVSVTRSGRHRRHDPDAGSPGRVELRFGRDDIDLRGLEIGQRVWKTDDPELTRRLRRSFEGAAGPQGGSRPSRRGDRRRAAPHHGPGRDRNRATVQSTAPLGEGRDSDRRPGPVLDPARPAGRDDLPAPRPGGDDRGPADGADEPAQPVAPRAGRPARDIGLGRAGTHARGRAGPARLFARHPVRTRPTVEDHRDHSRRDRALGPVPPHRPDRGGRRDRYLDDLRRLSGHQAISRARSTAAHRGSAAIYLATPRIEKPGEANLFGYLAKQGADGILVRNAGGLAFCSERGIPFVADFSLNASNPLTVELLKDRGAARVTASYDLNVDQLLDLLDATPPSWLEVVIHQQIPMFHMEHCVYCAFLSPGTDATNCGRPCDHHDVKLRDRVGKEHPLKADVGCRNTLYNAVPQTAAEYLPRLQKHGAPFLRIEFLDDSPETVERTIKLYREASAGPAMVKSLWRELKASNQYGVTRGPLAVL